MQRRTLLKVGLGAIAGTAVGGVGLNHFRDQWFEKRVKVIHPGQVIRGAWQGPGPLRRIIAREQIRTIVTLTAINADDPKYVGQNEVVHDTGVAWKFVRMKGSRATPEQMARAADLIADPANWPVFFHCVAGHHRTSLSHAAFRIRHEGWTVAQAWDEVSNLPWANATSDGADLRQIEDFAASSFAVKPTGV